MPLLSKDKRHREEDRIYIYDGLVYILRKLEKKVILIHYNNTDAGYRGIGSTIERIIRIFYFPAL